MREFFIIKTLKQRSKTKIEEEDACVKNVKIKWMDRTHDLHIFGLRQSHALQTKIQSRSPNKDKEELGSNTGPDKDIEKRWSNRGPLYIHSDQRQQHCGSNTWGSPNKDTDTTKIQIQRQQHCESNTRPSYISSHLYSIWLMVEQIHVTRLETIEHILLATDCHFEIRVEQWWNGYE